MESRTVNVNVSSSYTVTIGQNILGNCGDIIKQVVAPCKAAIITDSNVAPLYLETVVSSFSAVGYDTCSFAFPAGESSKTMSTLTYILEFLAKNRLTRSDCVVALGGGVVGDVTGFAAGCYLRGISYVQIPTTFLAGVDSSVGGKTAIDLNSGKNLAGLFIQPKSVICDTQCFSTLSDHFFADGVSEALKTAILIGDPLFSLMETSAIKECIPEIVEKCVIHKASVVEEDEFETGIRRTLNLGHTVGHAIEKCSNYKISHGHAVAIGTAIITRAATRLGYTSADVRNRIINLLKKCSLPTETEFSADVLTDAALSDKKRDGESITLVIPKEIGNCTLEKIPINQLNHFIKCGLET